MSDRLIDEITLIPCDLSVYEIPETECIGNSRIHINQNTKKLKDKVQSVCETLNNAVSATSDFLETIANPPIGSIIMWAGNIAEADGTQVSGSTINTLINNKTSLYPIIDGNVDANWLICNGADGKPDLRGRFVVGAGRQPGGNTDYSTESTGGEEIHSLTIPELPAHTHGISYSPWRGVGWLRRLREDSIEFPWNSWPFHRRILRRINPEFEDQVIEFDAGITATGDNQPHENRPPFYVVYYIMRVK